MSLLQKAAEGADEELQKLTSEWHECEGQAAALKEGLTQYSEDVYAAKNAATTIEAELTKLDAQMKSLSKRNESLVKETEAMLKDMEAAEKVNCFWLPYPIPCHLNCQFKSSSLCQTWFGFVRTGTISMLNPMISLDPPSTPTCG